MPKPMMAMGDGHKCFGWLVLLVGILFLIKDYAPASMTWWKVSVWPTAIFILIGVWKLCKHCCKK